MFEGLINIDEEFPSGYGERGSPDSSLLWNLQRLERVS
ncbi:hypothetical protein HNR54_001835 [Methanothermobacter sp. DSM 3267]